MRGVLYHAKGGLANRLRAMAGYRNLARFQKLPFYICWENNGACNVDFDELFEPDGWEDVNFITPEEMAELRKDPEIRFFSAGIWFADIWKKHGESVASKLDFYRASLQDLRSLTPRSEIRDQINQFLHPHDLGSHTGLHIRMTDNVYAYNWWAKQEPDFDPAKVSRPEGFTNLIAELEKLGKNVFLCTDNSKLAQDLLQRFGNVLTYRKDYDEKGFVSYVNTTHGQQNRMSRVIGRLKKVAGLNPPSTWRTTTISDALVDLILLGKCQSVVGTYYSSFGPVAAMFGGVPMSVIQGTLCVEHQTVKDMQMTVREIE